MTRCRFVSTMKAEGFPITAACEMADISTSAYSGWLAREAAGPTEADLAAVTAALNGRPRKTLEWRTPAEALDLLLQSGGPTSVATTA